jgi:3',5'-cyclic AMP phosphodiesterase CpdA
MSLQPVLQIVHVSDLHFKDTHSGDAKLLESSWAILERAMRGLAKKYNWFNWHEGTHGHYSQAPDAFSLFLAEDLVQKDLARNRQAEWFHQRADRPPTWLVDTGDLSAFGDQPAIDLGRKWLKRWCTELGAADFRSLVGNHDAWAGCHPAFSITAPAQITNAQRNLQQHADWNRSSWVSNPLTASLPGSRAKIELYALDSVCWGPRVNTFALGHIGSSALRRLVLQVSSVGAQDNFRILASHHPVSFPWRKDEITAAGVLPAMRLLNARKVGSRLENAVGTPDVGPLAHLILSGHTHHAWPTRDLPAAVDGIQQDCLGAYQLQLVTGALILNTSHLQQKARARSPFARPKAFSNYSVGGVRFRAQILRFYFDAARPWEVVMYRIPVLSVNCSKYRRGRPSRTVLYMQAP